MTGWRAVPWWLRAAAVASVLALGAAAVLEIVRVARDGERLPAPVSR